MSEDTTDADRTALQQIINDDVATELLDDLESLPLDEQPWELALQFSADDVPALKRELREMVEDDE